MITGCFTDIVDIDVTCVDSLVKNSGEVAVQHPKQFAEVSGSQRPVASGLLVQCILFKICRAPDIKEERRL